VIGLVGVRRDRELDGHVCPTCRAFPCSCPGPTRAEWCACGVLIVAPCDWQSIAAAVRLHNATERHVDWWGRSASEASGTRPDPDPRDMSSGRDGASAADLGGRP
jgi:hypothetical protein